MSKYKGLFKYVIPTGLVYLYVEYFLTQEKQKELFVRSHSVGSQKWMFAQLPKKSDGTDGILLSELRKESLWSVDEFIPNTQDFICKKHLLIIMVNSSPENVDRRNFIRKTWGFDNLARKNFTNRYDNGNKYKNIRTLFILGKSKSDHVQSNSLNESLAYGDMIMGDFEDTYMN